MAPQANADANLEQIPTCDLRRPRRRLLLALAGAALSACGGGAEPTAGPAMTAARRHPLGIGAGGTGYRVVSFLSAAVSSVGPIDVGDVQLSVGGARVCDGDGRPLHDSDVDVGMTARVEAGRIVVVNGIRRAQAQTLVVDTQVRGPARWLDARTLLVLGRRVVIGSPTLPGLNGVGAGGTGQSLRVWGQLDLARGRIVASRIDLAASGDAPMLRGLLTGIDRPNGVVQLGAVTARAADPLLLPADVAVGSLVRLVLGEAGPNGEWALLDLRDDALRPGDGLKAELEGRITQFGHAQHFELDGVPVDASQAQIEGLDILAAGAEAAVAGTMAGGVLMARKVAAQAAEPLELQGRIDSLDLLSQTLVVGSHVLHWSAVTRFVSSTAQDLRVGRKLAGLARWVPGQVALEATRLSVEK